VANAETEKCKLRGTGLRISHYSGHKGEVI
jgi:hypothetical protein